MHGSIRSRVAPVSSLALVAPVALLLLSACREPMHPASSPPGASLAAPAAREAFNGTSTVEVLAWLAPLGTGTPNPAAFNASATPVVEICAWTGSACASSPVARFTTSPIGTEQRLTANATAGQYEASWNLLDARFTTRKTYRVRVLQGTSTLGALSVDVVRGRWALTKPGALAPLTAASALPLRFYFGGDVGAAVIDQNGGTLSTPGGTVSMTIPAGAVSASTNFRVVSDPTLTPPARPGDTPLALTYRFEPDGLALGTPVTIVMTYSSVLANLPQGAGLSDIGVIHWNDQGTTAEVVSAVNDPATSTLTFSLDHFSQVSAMAAPPQIGFSTFLSRWWTTPTVTWYVAPSPLGSYVTRAQVQADLQVWESYSAIRFQEVLVRSAAQIVIEEKDLSSVPCPQDWRMPGGPFITGDGLTCFPTNTNGNSPHTMGASDRALVFLDSRTFPVNGQAYASQTLRHELGHALGINHPWAYTHSQNGPVMQRMLSPRTGLHQLDINAIQYLYGPPPPPTQVPATPGNLAALSPVRGTVVLKWTDNSSNETHFEVTRFDGNVLTTMPPIAANATTVTYSGLAPGVSYHWDLRACNGAMCSPFHGVVGKTPDGPYGLIAFSSIRTGNNEIFTMKPDGTGAINISNHSGDDSAPSWSPDGTRVAFHSNRSGAYNIYVKNVDTGLLEQLTSGVGINASPSWSADGSKIAFISTRDGNQEIYTATYPGGVATRITATASREYPPVFSPDGTMMAYWRDTPSGFAIYVLDVVDPAHPRMLTTSGQSLDPKWSPDGSLIAFWTSVEKVILMKPDGSNQQIFLNSTASEPAWSPDGQQIVFVRNTSICVIPSSGGAVTCLPNSAGSKGPSWGNHP